jgi:hypothetical protein
MWSYLGKSIFVHEEWRENEYILVNDGKYYAINSHKDKAKLSLISAHQKTRIMGSTNKFVFLFPREGNQQGEVNKL